MAQLAPPGPSTDAAVTPASLWRMGGGERPRCADDVVAVEAPLEIRLGTKPTTVIMRTPGHDEDLARGFFFTEGLIRHAADIAAIRRPDNLKPDEQGNVVEVQLSPPLVALRPAAVERNFYATSSCGVCGKSSLQALAFQADEVTSDFRIALSQLLGLPERLRAAQSAFDLTGGLHAAAWFDAQGEIVALREDVGRHNAVDKIVGWALAQGALPATRRGILVSGRTSFEILQKAAMAGAPLVCAVSAPSSLAIALAAQMGITLVGFLRHDALNVYSHPERIDDGR